MRWWSRVSLRRKLELLIFSLAIPVVITLVLMLFTAAQLRSAMDERTRYRDFLALISDLKVALLNIETGQRGYALSGKVEFLEPYTLGLEQVDKTWQSLLASNIRPEAVRHLQALVNDYINTFTKPSIKDVQAGKLLNQSNYGAFLKTSKRRFDEIRGLFAILEQSAQQSFDQSRVQTLKAVQTLNEIAWFIAAVVVIAIVVFRMALDQVIVGRLLPLQKATTEIAMGDYNSRVDVKGGDELGQLATSFNLMAASLQKTNLELKQANERDRLLASLSDALQGTTTPQEVTDIALAGLGEALGATNLYLSLLDGEDLRLTGWWGPLFPHVQSLVDEHRPLNTASAAKIWEVIVGGEATYSTRYWSPERQQHVALAVKPVRSPSGQILGALSVVRSQDRREWKEGEKELLRRSCTAIGIALERAKNLASLKTANAEYQRSNQELEQFAYVASHDLQEPLRMISSYTQLLARRYQGKLDDKADQYIHFAVDGANRMQQLIQDLLAYSRVGTRGKAFEPIESSKAVQDALRSLEVSIQESNAQIVVGELPKVMADPMQMTQVFQNLIGNALKYRDPARVPHIEVGAQQENGLWRFWVSDNGIGIEPQYFDRIFIIFQRLHNKQDYPGSGIGLAIVRKIVERHGGQIGIESTPGKGSRFWFTWPGVERHI